MSEAATIGHNEPPQTPYESCKDKIEGLYEEAKHWLDGEPIDKQEVADDLSNLKNMLVAARKAADEERKKEVKPLNEKKSAIQARYNALFAMADQAVATCRKALEPWLEKQEAEARAKEEVARRKAEEERREAEEAMRQREEADLASREAAEQQLERAKAAEKAAAKAAKDTGKAGGGIGRATGLRRTYVPVFRDPYTALMHYWSTDRPTIDELLIRLANRDIRSGAREIPGFDIEEEKIAV